ncbi:MAG: pyrroline-5-carboxylate reductase [Porticoccaceae bacterium]|nr:pyrroline-5-carboxylate reductase [Porticoccaceae bacterium]
MKNATIAFIGGGNMATSLIGGIVEKGFPAASVRVSEPVAEAREQLTARFGVAVTDDNHSACMNADVVVLAVKPQIMKPVACDLSDALGHKPVVVSIAAGIPVAALETWLGKGTPLVRAMPNTPALVHTGATGLFASPAVNGAQKSLVESLFSAIGSALWLDSEADIDAVTAVSGSGPAYFFLLMETMEKAGVDLGLTPEAARTLTLQTALGAARMAMDSDVDAAELRRRVSSPAGTTEKAINTFIDGDLPGLVARAMTAARDRAREMAAEFSI